LAQAAQRYGYHPEIILSGRRINDSMGKYVANQVIKLMLKKGIQVLGSHILVLGFTFKENCPDVRNTRVIDIVNILKEYNVKVTIHDPWADPLVAKREYRVDILNQLPDEKFDAVILAVAHEKFKELNINTVTNKNSVIYDVKGILTGEVDGRL